MYKYLNLHRCFFDGTALFHYILREKKIKNTIGNKNKRKIIIIIVCSN
jgi:hypothetical protein